MVVTVLVVAAPLPLANARGTMDPLDPLYNAPALAGVRRPQKPASELRARAAVGADDEQPTSTRLSLAIITSNRPRGWRRQQLWFCSRLSGTAGLVGARQSCGTRAGVLLDGFLLHSPLARRRGGGGLHGSSHASDTQT